MTKYRRFASRILSISFSRSKEPEDAAHVGREALDVADEVLLEVVGIALESFEGEQRMVVEVLFDRLVQHLSSALPWALQRRLLRSGAA